MGFKKRLQENGKSTGFVQLTDIPRLAAIRKGDTIVTGGQSVIFPENINIGTVDRIYIDNQTNYYTLDVKLFNDMTNLGHVYILKGNDREEIINLEKKNEKDEQCLVCKYFSFSAFAGSPNSYFQQYELFGLHQSISLCSFYNIISGKRQ